MKKRKAREWWAEFSGKGDHRGDYFIFMAKTNSEGRIRVREVVRHDRAEKGKK